MQGRQKLSAPPKKHTMRAPTIRPTNSRTMSAAPILNGRASPAESIASTIGPLSRSRSPAHNNGVKRKERDFEQELGEETNINVVVRCRGRNDREVKENSGVVVSADGIKGTSLDLSMGPNSISNKTYHFDKVFSPAADQSMVFEEVVAPILDEVIGGFNCTIFAYGQTGTGKTYTMSGDISDVMPLPDEAGIIPRVLHSLFDKLDSSETEKSVKCSFIELYNEELKDLLSADEAAKLKIFDDANRKSQTATLVQGMEECHIQSASRGIQLLRDGSHKRQVAATKCNDLSSRSHTIFTITLRTKVVSENGEDFVNAGKLNLVDLAGSENIQRSGAENKRATEAGLINKSLLTLGRVINALVDKNSHIPYRESKLTRLLQDSLGGRTKTCIIATLSPAKSNLEETISTLDYAFRAKNIRNKPQMNQMITKKTLFKEFTTEIEKLKGELIATRHRNGVYLTSETYEEMTIESESRRILSEEQRDKIETLEVNLRNKNQELFSLTTNFQTLKKDCETVKAALESTKGVLEKTEIVLEHTNKSLADEKLLREAHQTTEENLASIGYELIDTLGRTTSDISGLSSKLRRRSDLQALNRANWASSQNIVSEVTLSTEQQLREFEVSHQQLVVQLASRMNEFVQDEIQKVAVSQDFISAQAQTFEASEKEVNEQSGQAYNDMNQVLDEIKTLRDDVKKKVGNGLDGLTEAAQRISQGVISELETHHTQLHSSYTSLGKDLKKVFDQLVKDLDAQRTEADDLRKQLREAETELLAANELASANLDKVLAEEKEQAAAERNDLVSQITLLIQKQGSVQEKRLESKIHNIKQDISTSNQSFKTNRDVYTSSMDEWVAKETVLVDELLKSRETVKATIKKDWTTANECNSAIQATTRSVHGETIQIVDSQMKQMDVQLQALDEIISRVREQNSSHHEVHVMSLATLGSTVKRSHNSIKEHLTDATCRAATLERDMAEWSESLNASLSPISQELCTTLAELRADIVGTSLTEYVPTGMTPHKAHYSFVSTLPRTDEHEVLLLNSRQPSLLHNMDGIEDIPDLTTALSPSKARIFNDAEGNIETEEQESSPTVPSQIIRPTSAGSGLRELNLNLASGPHKFDNSKQNHTIQIPLNDVRPSKSDKAQQPPLKRQHTGNAHNTVSHFNVELKDFSASLGSKSSRRVAAEGRENAPPSAGRKLRARGQKS